MYIYIYIYTHTCMCINVYYRCTVYYSIVTCTNQHDGSHEGEFVLRELTITHKFR